jgi:hypothetical protein
MESINEQFHQIYNSSYNLPAYEAKPTTFTQKQLLEFSKAQHEYLTALALATNKPTKQQPVSSSPSSSSVVFNEASV